MVIDKGKSFCIAFLKLDGMIETLLPGYVGRFTQQVTVDVRRDKAIPTVGPLSKPSDNCSGAATHFEQNLSGF